MTQRSEAPENTDAGARHTSDLFAPVQPNRAHRRRVHGRGWNPGRLVLHRSRFSAAADDTPRASVLARRLRRAS